MVGQSGTIATVQRREVTVAITGQPNTGKSTTFNGLTREFQRVGNWPGKTVEKKTGTYTRGNCKYHITDLPGTYTMTVRSPEEKIAENFIVQNKPDIIVVMVSAAALERGLYFTSELLSLPARVVIALNMMDVAEKRGIQIDIERLEAALNMNVVPMVSSKHLGLEELKQAIEKVANMADYAPNAPTIDSKSDALSLAEERYSWVARVTTDTVQEPREEPVKSRGQRFDRYATHPVTGTLILIGVVLGAFGGSFVFGVPLVMKILEVPALLAGLVEPALTGILPVWVVALVVDGMIDAFAVVLAFLLFLTVFFTIWAVLDDVGYMARAAYLTHRFMNAIGLHGKSFMPLALCAGCNVAGATGTRIIEGERTRLLTLLLIPIMPCKAIMMFMMFLSQVFFPGPAGFVILIGLYALDTAIIALSGYLLNRFVLKGEKTGFILELPEYQKPNRLTVWKTVRHHTMQFLKKAGPVIMIMSITTWALAYFPSGDFNTSYLAMIGQYLTPFGDLMGCDWRWIVALITSTIQKENAFAVLAVLFGDDMIPTMQASLSPAGALAFMTAYMLSIPCMVTIAAIASESKSWKWAAFILVWVTFLSIAIAILTFQVASLFM